MFEPIGSPPTCVEVVVTAADADRLAGFARSLLDDGLAAAAHTVAPVQVLSRRAGTVHEEAQARVALHTRSVLVPAIVARAEQDRAEQDRVERDRAGHDRDEQDQAGRDRADDVPCVLALRVLDGNPDYLQWIVRETAGAPQYAGGRR